MNRQINELLSPCELCEHDICVDWHLGLLKSGLRDIAYVQCAGLLAVRAIKSIAITR